MKAAAPEDPLDVLDAGLGQLDVPPVLVGVEVDARRERSDELRQPRRERLVTVDAAGDHERDARLVDHQRIRFVHEREVERPVHQIGRVHRQQIAQVIEPGFLRGDVGDVRAVGGASRSGRHPLLNVADREPEHPIDRAHPLGVAPGQIVVERQDVHAAIGEGVERRRHHRRERLALARLHLDDVSIVERQRRDDLFVEWPLPEHAARCLARQREEGRPQRDERFPDRARGHEERGCGGGSPGRTARDRPLSSSAIAASGDS